MQNDNLKCKKCGADLKFNSDAESLTCTHCGTVIMTREVLSGENKKSRKKSDIKTLGNKLEFSEAVKQGETYLYKTEYIKAEEQFKLAISFDEKNYIGYMGVVRAKTKNLSQIPSNDDYKYYAKQAYELARDDEKIYIKNELEKLELLKQEFIKNKKELHKNKEKQKRIEEGRRIKANFFSKLAYFLTGLIAVVVLIGLVVFPIIDEKENAPSPSTIVVNSTKDFLDFAKNKKCLGSTIILKSNLDFNGQTISPIGENSAFSGTFQGNGYKIKNLNVISSSQENNNIGLFAKLDGAKVYGLVLENVTIKNKIDETGSLSSNAGIIAGYSLNSQILNCSVYNSCNLSLKNTNSQIFAGGLIGQAETSTISLSYSQAKISIEENGNSKQSMYVGGIVGYLNNSELSSCYFAGDIQTNTNFVVKTKHYFGGIVGISSLNLASSCIKQSYFAGTVSNKTLQKENVECHIAMISNYNTEPGPNKIHLNIGFIEENKFLNNDEQIETSMLSDYFSDNRYFELAETEQALIEKVSSIFSNELWIELNTKTPKLKIEQKGITNSDGFLL